MQRRRFLKTAAGIFVPAACGIVRAQPFQLNDPALLAATRPKASGVPDYLTGLVLRYSADMGAYSDLGTTPCTDNTLVEQWNDQSASGYNATQTTSNRRPTWFSTTHSQNGLPVLYFDSATSNNMVLTPGIASGDLTVFWAGTPINTSAGPNIFDCHVNPLTLYFNSATNLGWDGNSGSGGNHTITNPTNNPSTFCFQFNSTGSSTYEYQNGTKLTPAQTYAQGGLLSTSHICSLYNGNGTYFNCYFFEFRIYNSDIGDTNIATVQNYLKTKWGTI